jgi:hypothetical protein
MIPLFVYISTLMLLLLFTALGIYIYCSKHLKERVNMKEVWQLFGIIFFLKIFDILSTLYFISILGIEAEGNLLAKIFMYKLGINAGLLLIFLFSLPNLFFMFILTNYVFRNTLAWQTFKMTIITVNVLVPLINLSII